MRIFGKLAHRAGLAVFSTSLLPPATARPAEQERVRSNLVREGERKAVSRALAGAARRLERKGCQRIFADFVDGSGRSLQESLDAIGQDGASFLRDWIFFAEGRQEPTCARTGVLAFTQPGSRSVWICGRRFQREQWRDPGYAEVALIHEALHSLGLGEDPPTTEAITRQVRSRCGASSGDAGGRDRAAAIGAARPGSQGSVLTRPR